MANNTASYYNFNAKEGCVAHNTINRGMVILNDDRVESFIYDNDIEYGQIRVWGDDGNSVFYIKQNRIMSNGVGNGIEGHETYAEISDNYLVGCGIDTYFVNGTINNNIIKNGNVSIHENINYFNNINYNYDSLDYAFSSYRDNISNNIFVNNYPELLSDSTDSLFTNCIILRNGDSHWWPNPHGSDTFRNCIIDFPLDPPLVDGGGNIIVDSLQAQLIFEDIENGDFHLAEGSIAIDAGFDTLGYYYPFDLENSLRVWDGDGDGNAIIDIGAYEYGAPQLGKICGFITETDTGEPVDYVLIKADNEPGEFTFADSSGYFEIQLPEGTYDLYTERVFYEDNVIYTVTVNNEETTELEFNMTSNFPHVGINEECIINNEQFNLMNYPNPFNPTTTISYSLVSDTQVELTVYNVKGQKVKTLVNKPQQAGTRSVIWNGQDDQNKAVSSGIYFYKIKTDSDVKMRKMILMK